jgi:hypothetical protein
VIGRAGVPAGRGPMTGTEVGPTAKGIELHVPDRPEYVTEFRKQSTYPCWAIAEPVSLRGVKRRSNLSFGTAIVIPAYAGIHSGPRIKSGVTVSLAAGS